MSFDELVPIIKPTLLKLEDISEELRDVLSTGMITNHKYVKIFEEKVAEYLGVKHAVAVSSATSALMLVIKELVPSYSEVIVPSLTHVATVHSLMWNNIRPVFVDVDDTLTIDPTLIEEKITPQTRGILAVNLFGNSSDVQALEKVADRRHLKLIFDSAESFGAKYKGKLLGGFEQAEIFSLAPTKVLTAAEGGIVTTNNDDLADRIRMGRDYGCVGQYDCRMIGLSARMSEFHAIIAIKSLRELEGNIKMRNTLATTYYDNLEPIRTISFPKHLSNTRSVWYTFPILLSDQKEREWLAQELLKRRIHVKWTYFYPCVHQQKAYFQYKSTSLPRSEDFSNRILSLPLYSHLKLEKVVKICNIIKNLYKNR
jgi:dTDP-4-amino-4,6-dideoxygalactose transaminase